MDVDIVKAAASSGSDSTSMDMIAMMMQMEKFPDLCDPFYNTATLNTNNDDFSAANLVHPIPALNYSANFLPSFQQQQQPMSPQPPLHQEANKRNSMAAMREMIFRVAVMQPVHIDPESVKPPKRRNVRISKDPQSVAARHRRERISERIRILQRLVPGGTKMDTASMLDEAIHYVKFLKKQVQTLEQASVSGSGTAATPIRPMNFTGFSGANNNSNVGGYSAFVKGCHHQPYPMMLGSSASSKQLLS